ncbi:tonB-dependent Receptor Plug domain protein [Janthinobacterium agaricidamnosum NBRC 102515 = DSM 9628]|uniref:TonB-dependent Receptor Plug domain protein n=1 Tax=Janthinobacterium agaricidamnosum NBRC 102515 = DSM 9628 TaxID=1349767 RepID=W0V9W8_9BURK|nr:tonB-dependent Receptor Plug domain protein [Janthinobacterium agaricidamnosum NBRC 102515 = DSM 9628]
MAAMLAMLGAAHPGLASADDGGSPPASVLISGSRTSQLGIADSANAGVVTQQQLEARTVYRPGELLEATPGLIVSQHSGEGKANQFYLRGFNLDHGTDLSTTIDGMPVNQRSHAHGQGWSDLNFLIPELATRLEYRKGPYAAEDGDFASAGAVSIQYADKLPDGIASVGVGQNGYRRALLADSPQVGQGNLLYALELFHNDGPFIQGDDFSKVNGVLRYSQGDTANGFNVTAMAYHASWNSSDQLPRRAVDDGTLDRFGAVDPSDGGNARRYSLSGEWRSGNETSSSKVHAYLIRNQLDLYSNFTYLLDDPVHGDQFNQPDRRVTSGIDASHVWTGRWFDYAMENKVGLQLQNDNIFNGLYSTAARQRLSTTRQDHIVETSLGLYLENVIRWNHKFRSVAGLRADHYRFDVDSDLAANSGRTSDQRYSPKLSLIFGPWLRTEYYVNVGQGFHSNDARGTTISVDPKSGDAVDRVTPLVRSRGMEVGVRSEWLPGLQSSLSLYRLDFDSELVFAGDAGTTEAGRPSRRTGVELSNYYKPVSWLTIDADLAFARARFRDVDPVGSRIPGAVEGVASLALAVDHIGKYFGALQLRYFGPRPLIEDNSVRSQSTATLNGRIGYKINPRMKIELEGFNLTNRRDSAIDYYYVSRLPGEAADGVADVHFHPIESRSLRLTLNSTF